jgi:hypothetical protein
MIQLIKAYSVTCDGCDAALTVWKRTAPEARAAALYDHGWAYKRHRDLCPACAHTAAHDDLEERLARKWGLGAELEGWQWRIRPSGESAEKRPGGDEKCSTRARAGDLKGPASSGGGSARSARGTKGLKWRHQPLAVQMTIMAIRHPREDPARIWAGGSLASRSRITMGT